MMVEITKVVVVIGKLRNMLNRNIEENHQMLLNPTEVVEHNLLFMEVYF